METETDVIFVRIYLHEADQGRRRSLLQEILTSLKDQHRVRGITVFRGIAGVGDAGEVQAADLLRLMVDLPLVIEFYDAPMVAKGVIKTLESLVQGHPVVSWPATLTSVRNDGGAPA